MQRHFQHDGLKDLSQISHDVIHDAGRVPFSCLMSAEMRVMPRVLDLRISRPSGRPVPSSFTSFILLQKGDVPGDRTAVTWVHVAPGSAQWPHAHGSEQIYVIIRGRL